MDYESSYRKYFVKYKEVKAFETDLCFWNCMLCKLYIIPDINSVHFTDIKMYLYFYLYYLIKI